MTVQASSFGQAWIVASIGLWLASAVAGAAYLAPRANRAARLFETEGPKLARRAAAHPGRWRRDGLGASRTLLAARC